MDTILRDWFQVYEIMESANEQIDNRRFIDATKQLKSVEDSIKNILSQDQTDQVANFDWWLVIVRVLCPKIKGVVGR